MLARDLSKQPAQPADKDCVDNEIAQLTATLVRYASVTPDCTAVLNFVQGWLEPLGFRCERIRGQSSSYAVDNLYARYGDQEPLFGFCGHVDVVPVGNKADWSADPFSGHSADGKLYGRGAVDMKSGLACFMVAAKRFLAAHPNFHGSIALLITGDEEDEAEAGVVEILRWMAKNNQQLAHCLVGEPSGRAQLGDTIKIGRRGSLTAELTITGVQGHVAYPEKVVNPIHQLVQVLGLLQSQALDQGSQHFDASSLQVTSVDVGNKASNVVPRQAKARFNVRFNDHWSAKTLAAHLEAQIKSFGFHYDFQWRSSAESFVYPPKAFAEQIAQVVEQLCGRKPEFLTNGGTSDARFISEHCPVAEFGLVGTSMHQVDEYVLIDQLEPLARCYLAILEQYF